MQQANDNMEEEFRNAAENYPLKTDSADWDAVARKLSSSKQTHGSARYGYIYFLLILLIPVGIGAYYYLKNDRNILSAKLFPSVLPKALTQFPESNKTNLTVAQTLVQSNASSNILDKGVKADVNKQPIMIPQEQHNHIVNGATPEVYRKSDDLKAIEDQNINAEVKNLQDTSTAVSTLKKAKPLISIDVKKSTPRLKRFYVGVIAGMDVSTIKLQEINKTGRQAGIIAGYKVNSKLSLETGVIKDLKKYYTKGEHFNTTSMNMPTTVKINAVTGQCKMIEVPMNVKYAIHQGKNAQLYALAGSSSYFMSAEDYTYVIQYNNGVPYPKNYSYRKKSASLFSVLNIGAGVAMPLGKNVELRVEPYAKLPMKGVGTGKLPITSAGINIGIVKPM